MNFILIIQAEEHKDKRIREICSFVLMSKNKKIVYLISAQIVFFLPNGVSFLLIGNFLLCLPFFFLIDKSDFQVSFLLFFFNLFHRGEDLR